MQQLVVHSAEPADVQATLQASDWTIEALRDLREGTLQSPVSLGVIIDAMSVYAATTANHIKIPAEKGLLSHLQYVRELVDRGILKFLAWTDTRDMLADALTKGAVERDRIELAMSGFLRFDHAQKAWEPRIRSTVPSD